MGTSQEIGDSKGLLGIWAIYSEIACHGEGGAEEEVFYGGFHAVEEGNDG